MKSIWSGYISFGLVTIPIRLYSAIEHKAVSFRLLHKEDNSPIKYKRFCEKEEKEVAWDEIVKGLELRKGVYYVMSQEEIQKLKPQKSDTIDIIEFGDLSQVDPIYYNNHYYIGPDRVKDKAFFLLKEVLMATGKFAVGRFVMREKEYTCIISPYKNGMILSTLNYAYEIRDINSIEELKESPILRDEEKALAKQLIDNLYQKEFDISVFKDEFLEKLKDAIKKKEEGIEVGVSHKPAPTTNLLEALKASLKEKAEA